MATTPAIIKLKRKDTGVILRFEKEGYKPIEVILRRGVSGWIWGNLVFSYGGPIGLAIDFITGAAYKLSPAEVHTVLQKQDLSMNNLPKDEIIVAIDKVSVQFPKELNETVDKKPMDKFHRVIYPGDRVRVGRAPYEGAIKSIVYRQESGAVVSLDTDTLVLKVKGQVAPLTIPLTSVTRFEVNRGKKVNRVKGAWVGGGMGLLTGGIAGVLILKATCEGEESVLFKDDCKKTPPVLAFVIGATAGFVPLAIPFAIIGAVASPYRHDRWEPVPLPLQMGFSPHGGVRVALRFDFGK